MHQQGTNRLGLTRGRRRRWAALACAAALAIGSASALAQNGPGRRPGPGGPPRAASAAGVLEASVQQFEDEIAALAQQRGEVQPEKAPGLELRIDVRVLARWLATRAADAKDDPAAQAALYLRARDTAKLVEHVDAWADFNKNAPTRTQIEAMLRLRQLTYRLEQMTGGAQVDAACRDVANNVRGALSPAPPATQLPVPRPPQQVPPRPNRNPAGDADPKDDTLTPEQIGERAQTMSLSRPLRAQIVALAQAAADPAPDAEKLRDTLRDAYDLALGLQTNVGLSPEARMATEKQLTDALALYTDARTRPAGEKRLAAMKGYKGMLSRLAAIKLPQPVMQQLAPAFVYARENPDVGGKLIDAIATYAAETDRHASIKPDANLPDAYNRGVNELRRQFVARAGNFVNDAAGVNGRSIMATNVDDVAASAAELRRLNDLIEAITRLPATLDRLAAFKPRPTGMLEKRVITAIVQASSDKPSEQRDQSAALLVGLHGLVKQANELEEQEGKLPKPEVIAAYAGGPGGVRAMKDRWRAQITEIASKLAEGEPLDADRLARVGRTREVMAALVDAAGLQEDVDACDKLVGWVDWTITTAEAEAVLQPYRDALANAVNTGDPDAIDRFRRIRDRYAAFIALLHRTAPYAPATAKFATGFDGVVSRLAAPLEGAPFAAQRYASFGIDLVLEQARADPASVDAAWTAFHQHLARELGLRAPARGR